MQRNLSIRFFLSKHNPKTGKYKVYVRIIYNRQKKEIALSHSVTLEDWNDDQQRTVKNRRLNEELSHKENQLYEIKREMEYKGEKITAQRIKDAFTGKSNKKVWLLIDYFANFIESIKDSPNHSKGSIEFYQKSLLHLSTYLDYAQKKQIIITDIDRVFIENWDYFLINRVSRFTKQKLSRNYVNGLHEKLRAVLNYAIKEDIIASNAYKGFVLKDEETTRTYLNREELESIEGHSLGGNISLKRVRDIFIFSVYTGLRFSDATSLRPQDIYKSRNRFWIKIKQEKTDTMVEIPLIESAVKLYNKWNKTEESKLTGFLLPRITNQKLNAYLKVIAELCGITKALTHHVARHTFATVICLENNISLEDTSKLLGHANISTTQIYAKITRNRLSNVADTLDAALKKK